MSDAPVVNEANRPSPTYAYSPYVLWPIWIVWLPFIFPPTVQFIQSMPHIQLLRSCIGLLCIVFFVCLYSWATLQNARALVAVSNSSVANPKWLSISLLIALSLILILLDMGQDYGNAWFSTLIFTSAYISGRLPTIQALIAITLLSMTTIAIGVLVHLASFENGQSTIFVFLVGIVTISVTRAISTGQQLRSAREEIAHLAVTTERLRIARDLHDLLGHNLSLIALKSELAGRLLTIAPERAASEIRDVESVARTTLQEVREAVAAYRQPTLLNELHAAQEILTAANIVYHFDDDEKVLLALPPSVEAVMAWLVREGVTNVIKHSRAQQCTIHLIMDTRYIRAEITDDGIGVDASSINEGNGLRGLAERITALGGQYESGPRDGGGFKLSASLPLTQKFRLADQVHTSIERSERR